LHWTWEYVDEHMTLPRMYALSKQWRMFPPVRITVASAFGYKLPTADSITVQRAEEPPEYED
jgi:hypothetical protein